MAINEQKLFEFAIKLIDIQIKKYQALAVRGVGPDAKVSAALIQKQVNDLLMNLIPLLNKPKLDEEDLLGFATLMKFYLDCEFLRGRAGWLLDSNNIHNTVYERVSGQLNELEELCADATETLTDPERLTEEQKQYLHDSHEIAYFRFGNQSKRRSEQN